MNWLLILIIVLLLGNLIWGYKRGFLRAAFSLISWIAVLVVCYIVTPIAVDFVVEKTDVVTIVEEHITKKLNEAFDEAAYAEFEAALPEEIRKALLVDTESSEEILDTTTDEEGNVVNPFGVLVNSTGIVYTVLFFVVSIAVVLLARLIVKIVDAVLGFASKLPLIGPLDKSLGAIFGAAKGYVWCSLVLVVITMLALTGTNTQWLAMVNDSEILTWFYDNNIIINMVLESI